MAISEITGLNSIPLSNAGNRLGDEVPRAAATPAQEALQEKAAQVNEALRNLNFELEPETNALLINNIPAPLEAAEIFDDLSLDQQSALAINAALRNLNFEPGQPADPLLINEITPFLEESEILSDLNLVQQGVLTINEALININFTPEEAANLLANQALAAQVGGVLQPLPPLAQEITVTLAAAGVTLPLAVPQDLAAIITGAAAPVTAAAVAAPTVAPTPAAVTPTALTIPVTARFVPPYLFNPAMLPLTLYPDQTPYVLAVYQLNDTTTLPGPAEPLDREIVPTVPVVLTRALGEARLRQALQTAREGGPLRKNEYDADQPFLTLAQAEKAILYTIDKVNSDLTDHGLPLHLVFTKKETGLALDVYDCSYKEACRVTYDVAIPLNNLTGVLGKLQQETGIIMDKTS